MKSAKTPPPPHKREDENIESLKGEIDRRYGPGYGDVEEKSEKKRSKGR